MALQITATFNGGAQMPNAYARITRLVIEPDSEFVSVYLEVLSSAAAREAVKSNTALVASKQAAKAAAQAAADAAQAGSDAAKAAQAQVIQLGIDAATAQEAVLAVQSIMGSDPIHIPVTAMAPHWYDVTATMVYDYLAANVFPGAVALQ